jgi:hypothetical protein
MVSKATTSPKRFEALRTESNVGGIPESTRAARFHGPVKTWMFGFDSIGSMEGRPEVLLNFRLWNTHVDHVGDQLNCTLDRSRVKVGLVGDATLDPKLFQSAGEVMHLAFQTGCIYVGQGEQLVYAGPHQNKEAQGRL